MESKEAPHGNMGSEVEVVDAGTMAAKDDDASTVMAGHSVPRECDVAAAAESVSSSQHSEDTDSWTVLDNEDNDSPFMDDTMTSVRDDDEDDEHQEEEGSDSDIETLEILGSYSVQEAAELKSVEWLPGGGGFVNVEPCSRCSELPAEFPSIEKCHTYIHRPNKQLNALLSSFVVVGMLLVVGFGVGHFLGWSEKLEQLQEEEEGRIEENPEEFLQAGVIRRLAEENNRLRLALASQMKVCGSNNSSSAAAPLPAVLLLRQRINDLLVANADLEKEVARLRYSSPTSSPTAAAETAVDSDDLLKAKISLNDVTEENEQLKIEVGKARYGSSHSNVVNDDDDDATDDDDGGSVLDYVKKIGSCLKSGWKDAKEEAGRLVVGLSGCDDVATLIEEHVDAVIRSVPQAIAPAGKKLVSGAKKAARQLKETVDKGISGASKFLESQLGEDPSEWKERQLEKLKRGFGRMANRWSRVYDAWNGHDNDDDDDDDEMSEKLRRKKTKNEEKKTKGTKKKVAAETEEPGRSAWLFARAHGREHRRKEDSRSDWLFDRAAKRQKRGDGDGDFSSDWYENRINRHHR